MLETTEQARGHQYAFHRLTGRADLQLDAAVAELRDAGHTGTAERISRELIGRNVLAGRWSFQVVDGYYRCFNTSNGWCVSSWPAGNVIFSKRR